MQFISRYRGYTPLWNDVRQINSRNALKILAALSLLGYSVFWNIFLMYRLVKRWPTPLDNYQQLKSFPLVNQDVMRSYGTPSAEENAVVTCLYTGSYATAIANLGHSLDRVNSTSKRLLFYLPEHISPRALCIATATGFTPYPVSRIDPPNNGEGTNARFMDAYSKLNLWSLSDVGIKAVVHLDADTLVVRNFDELFALPFNFAAAPDAYIGSHGFTLEYNTGVIFARPSRAVFDDMMHKMQSGTYDHTQADQGFLNQYYAGDGIRLPYAYNANLAIKKRKPEMWADLKRTARIVHYTLVKPFVAEADNSGKTVLGIEDLAQNVQNRMGEFDGAFAEELEEWLDVWEETYRLYGAALTQCTQDHLA